MDYSLNSLPPELRNAPRDIFVYDVSFASIANATSAQASINFEASSTFVWMAGVLMADIAGAAQTSDSQVLPLCTVQINDTGASRNLFNQPVPLSSLFGQWGTPIHLPSQRVVQANSTLQFTVANYSAATTYANLHLSLIGVKIFASVQRTVG